MIDELTCNCQKDVASCPLGCICLTESVIHRATIPAYDSKMKDIHPRIKEPCNCQTDVDTAGNTDCAKSQSIVVNVMIATFEFVNV